MAETCRQILREVGVNPERMVLEWASAAEGPRFVELITNYVSGIKSLGPLGSAEGEAGVEVLADRLDAAVKAAGARRVRTALGTLAKNFHKSGDYNPEVIEKRVADKVMPAFRQVRLTEEIVKNLTETGAMTPAALSKQTGVGKDEIVKILEAMAKKGKCEKKPKGTKWALAR